MTESWLIYGATGYTGRMLARQARARGLTPVLAGRDAARLRRLADSLGFEYRAAPIEDPAALGRLLRGSRLVLNAAGPFVATAGPLVAASMAAGAHYLDVTGEPAVFAALARLDARARRRGVMLLPGSGFVLVATDCLAAHVARRLPGAARLRLGISLPASFAGRGSLRTVARHLGAGVRVLRGGRLTVLSGSLEHDFDYGRGPQTSVATDWADTVTAGGTTGIPDVEVYVDLLPAERAALQAGRLFAGWLRTPFGQALLQEKIEAAAEGPPPAARRRARCVVVAEATEAENRAGRRAVSRLYSPDQYTFTAGSALALAERVLAGDLAPGFQTPARVYGPDFVLGLEGVTREDLPGRSYPPSGRADNRSRSSRASTRSRVENPSVKTP